MAHSLVQNRALWRLGFVGLGCAVCVAAACYSRGSRQEPRRGMDGLWCPEDSARMAYVINRGPGPARLMIRRFASLRNDEADLAVLAARESGEYRVADSVIVFVHDPETATPVPRGHAPAIPPTGAARPRVEIEYFCR